MAIEYNFTLDMDRSKRDNNIAYARTGDVDSITINADLVLNGAAYTPSGTNAFFECITPNGHSIRAAAEKSGSSVSVDVPSAAFQAAGVINVAYFRFETGSADNPTYVESTEPFAIVVREGIGDNIDAGDYIEEWRQLIDKLDEIVAEVEQKAEQAETAINEQKTEVDQLKAQVQTSMAQDAEDVSDAKDTAISNINSSQGAVDAAIEQLEQKTQEAIDATQDALDGTLAANLQNAINRTLKLDVADMTNIPSSASLSSYTTVGSYCCKTASAAATISDSPVDDSPFNLYVFSSATSGQVMQLVVPIDLQGKPTAEWHVRFGTSSAMDPWSVIGGGADIAAGLGIDVTGDAQKTVSIDTTAFYQHHEATDIIQGSTEVTGGGRIKELKVYGNTRQNLWTNPVVSRNGITTTENDDGSLTISGTSTGSLYYGAITYVLRPSTTYTLSVDKDVSFQGFYIAEYGVDGEGLGSHYVTKANKPMTFVTSADMTFVRCAVAVRYASQTVSGTYYVMLNEGSTAQPWCPPGLNGVDELSVVCAGKNLLAPMLESAPVDDMVTVDTVAQTFSVHGENAGAAKLLAYFTGSIALESAARIGQLRVVTNISQSDKVYFQINVANMDGSNEVSAAYVGNSTFRDVFTVSPTQKITAIFFAIAPASTVDLDGLWVAVVRDGEDVDGHPLYVEPSVTEIDLDGHTLDSLPDGTRDELSVDATGAVTLVQRVCVVDYEASDVVINHPDYVEVRLSRSYAGGTDFSRRRQLSDFAPIGNADQTPGYPVIATYTLNSQTFLRGGTGTTEASSSAQSTAFKAMLGSQTWHHFYKLATPETINLPSVTLPELASPDYTVFVSSNIPAEIEADVVKVDYLPAPDVYTKEEVDQKIEDAGGMPDIVPVSQGGTGVTTAAAERNRLGLGNTTGAVPVANGGTGGTTGKAAQYNLLNDMQEATNTVSDSTFAMFSYASGDTTNGIAHKRKMSNVWNYIATKIRAVFGFNTSNVLDVEHGGTGATSAVNARANLSVYSKAEVDGKVPKVVYGTGNIPSDAENGTIYIQYRS